jgi:aminoglycoside phosphotransferase family enzyme/predicted kinase
MTVRVDQETVFQALLQSGAYPHPVERITVQETHISKVFLTGARVYKIKKAVDFGFLNYATLDRRLHYCRQEVLLNGRLAPSVYLGVTPVTFDGRTVTLQGDGDIVEYAVCMRQLRAEQSLLNRLHAGRVDDKEAAAIVDRLVLFYHQADASPASAAWGALDIIAQNCRDNFSQIFPLVGEEISSRRLTAIEQATDLFLERHGTIFRQRLQDGFIRDGHGDLRCGHIYIEDDIQIIDCIEFDARYRCGDVAADIAFLAMDLDVEGFPQTARTIAESYARRAGDPLLLMLLDFYKCYRAMVRVKVNLLRLQEKGVGTAEAAKLRRHTKRFGELAFAYALCFTRPTVWVFCGLPASGKSTVAADLGNALGIDVLSSDRIRKAIFDLTPEDHRPSAWAEGIYAPGAGRRTYAQMLQEAHEELSRGLSVVLDATFSRGKDRRQALILARDHDANIIFAECRAPEAELRKRLTRREREPGVSDARLDHWKHFQEHYEPIVDMAAPMHMVLDTTRPVEELLLDLMAADTAMRAEQIGRKLKES